MRRVGFIGIVAFVCLNNLRVNGASNMKNELDSLYQTFNNSKLHDSVRIKTLKAFTKQFIYQDPDSALTLVKEFKPIFYRQNSDLHNAEYYYLEGTCYHRCIFT